MHKAHDGKHDHKDVKSSREIAMEKAQSMSAGTPPGEKKAEAPIPGEELTTLRQKAAKADEYYDRLLRTAADLENYKKRVERERSDLLKFANEELMAELTTVLDNFERALSAAASTPATGNIIEGVKLIQKQLLTVLKKYGLQPISALGQPFNPEFHEAVAEVETDQYPEGTIIAEQLRGYTLNGRLLRPSVVTVAQSKKTAVAGKEHGGGAQPDGAGGEGAKGTRSPEPLK
ncbi:MAG: nucleotide exchange factor GrpE [Candidatus Aureabacteria bacterium]|nr:nucleotide exchange factor GrpE [Candidatus Auribacterota bacterium]